MDVSRKSLDRLAFLFCAYGIAGVSVTLALLVTRALQPTVFPTPLFFAAIVISTWYGNAGAGLFAVFLATVLLEYFFISPDRRLPDYPGEIIYLGQFSMPALLTCWFVKKRKEAETALKEARDQLEVKVQLRTAELRQSNAQLRSEIEERRRAEETVQKTQADLAHLTRITSMSALASSIAHEVNQPLAAIVSNGDACLRWLAADPPNLVRARDSVTRIVGEGNRAGEVVRRIRKLSTKSPPQKEVIEFEELIDDVMALLEAEFVRHEIQLIYDTLDKPALIFGDRVQLQQVLLNLVLNAIESMSQVDARPRILTVRSQVLSTHRLRVSIRDNGSGFDSVDADHLFETFFTTKPEGIGMGLAISRTIVEAHGGQISATNNSDHGATFLLELPTADSSNET